MDRPPPGPTRPATLLPYTPVFLSLLARGARTFCHRVDARQRAVGEVGLHLRLAQACRVAGDAGGATDRIAGVAGGVLERVADLAEIALEVVGVGGIHR